jgi:hypothetical protein
MDLVTSKSTQVTVNILGCTRVETIHGNQCTQSGYQTYRFAQEPELTSYGTQKSVSYEVQPTRDHVQKSIRGMQMSKEGRKICNMTVCCYVSEMFPAIGYE